MELNLYYGISDRKDLVVIKRKFQRDKTLMKLKISDTPITK